MKYRKQAVLPGEPRLSICCSCRLISAADTSDSSKLTEVLLSSLYFSETSRIYIRRHYACACQRQAENAQPAGNAELLPSSPERGRYKKDKKQFLFICKDSLKISYFFLQLIVFSLDFFPFQPGQRTQAHIHDCLCRYRAALYGKQGKADRKNRRFGQG